MEPVRLQPITIESVDAAIVDWFDRTVDARVETATQGGYKVPVKMASGERWLTAREKKGIRDDSGKLILPIISVRRSGIDPDLTMSALGVETPVLQVAKRISKKTNNLQNLDAAANSSQKFAISPVVYEVTTIPFPKKKVLNYELQIQTQYQEQMNAILEKIFDRMELQNSFVAPIDNVHRQPPKGQQFEDRKPLDSHYVVGFFDSSASDAGNLEEFTDQERIIRFTTTVRVPAVLQLDPEGTRPAVQIERTAFGLSFGDERVTFVDDPEDLELIFGSGKVKEK